jgi:hypothetical protein
LGRPCRFAASTIRRTTGSSRASPSRYQDFTGCGNTLNMQAPQVLQLLMDSLRYWVEEMHVDGLPFRSGGGACARVACRWTGCRHFST